MYSVEKTRGMNFWKQFDYPIFITVLILSIIGIIVIISATKVMPNGVDGSRIPLVQAIGLVLGIIGALIICALDYNDLKTLGIVFYLGCIGLLVAVLFMGHGENLGSRSWLKVGPLSVQPSEFAKVAFIIIVSIYLEKIWEGSRDILNILKLLVFAAAPIVLIFAQHDFGTTMVFVFILFIMVFISGIPYKYIMILATTFFMSLPFIWLFALNDKRKDRIRVFFDPELDPLGSGMNVIRSKIAIGSGQIFGKGLFNGLQTQTAGVPVKESDFIFSVVGEELGFVGCMIIISLLFFLLIRSIYIARSARDSYGTFLVVGATAMFAFHTIENIGMTIGLLPVTGLPLPFISQGVSSMLTNYLAVGIILSVSMRRKKAIFNSDE